MAVLSSTLESIKNYCAYQERCHYEVRNKLNTLACYGEDQDEAIGILIEENYLNEERFAVQYAGSKFRVNGWGRVKIKQALKQKHLSDYCIKKALTAIPEDDYKASLEKFYEKKREALQSESNEWKKQQKIVQYLMQKGFELTLIQDLL